MARPSRPPGFDMTYRPTESTFGPPFAARIPSLLYLALALAGVAAVVLAEHSSSNSWLYVNIVERGWSKISNEGIDSLIHGNLSAAFYCARAVLPQMRAQGGGQMIHTSSMSGRNIGPMPGPGYIASKHGVVAMSHSINVEECVNNIRSTVVCPGEVNTPILAQRPNPLSQDDLNKMLQPEDCGDLIRYIACLPAHVTLNEAWITPTWNRGYVAALGRKL